MPMPADIVNEALGSCATTLFIGDIEEGTEVARLALRLYMPYLRALLRGAHWNFGRRCEPLVLLADATGTTPDVGTLVPTPWVYEYALPTDCVQARYVPWNNQQLIVTAPLGNIATPTTPLVGGLGPAPAALRIMPARFLVATDLNYLPPGQLDADTPGISPQGRTVILTNVQCAQLIYTAEMTWPNVWDALFHQAFVAYLAQGLVLAVQKDKALARALRAEQIAVAKGALAAARDRDGAEGWANIDHIPDWIRIRGSGYGTNAWGSDNGPGVLGYGWGALSFADGSPAY